MPTKPKPKDPLLFDLNSSKPFTGTITDSFHAKADFIPALGYRQNNEGHIFISGPTGAGKSYLISQMLQMDKKRRPYYLFTDTYQTIDPAYLPLFKKKRMKIVVTGAQYQEMLRTVEEEKNQDQKEENTSDQEEIQLNEWLKGHHKCLIPYTNWTPCHFKPDPSTPHFRYILESDHVYKRSTSNFNLLWSRRPTCSIETQRFYGGIMHAVDMLKQKSTKGNLLDSKSKNESKPRMQYYINGSEQKKGFFNNSICVFDDCRQSVFQNIKDKLLETGRKFGTVIINAVHDIRSGNEVKTARNDSEWLIGYPGDNKSKLIGFMVDVMRIPSNRAETILNQAASDGSNIMFHQFSPMFIASNKTIWANL